MAPSNLLSPQPRRRSIIVDEGAAASDAGREYADWIAEQYVAEYSRKAELAASGRSMITMSSGLLGLSVAIVAFSPFVPDYQVPVWIQLMFGAAMAALLASAGLAITAGHRHRYEILNCTSMNRMLDDEHWHDDPADARLIISTVRLRTIRTLRKGNNNSAQLLHIGQYFQMGFLCLIVLTFLSTVLFATPALPPCIVKLQVIP